jgi:DNA (cytosine-5)-methyltransferase 1
MVNGQLQNCRMTHESYSAIRSWQTSSGEFLKFCFPDVTILIRALRFAKIIYIDSELQRAHVQWFEHSSKTAMCEISDPEELFLTDICDGLDLHCIVGKANVHQYDFKAGSRPAMSHHDFYCK